MAWPGHDIPPPVIIDAGRPGHHFRSRQTSDHMLPHPAYYTGPDGQLLVPAQGVRRASSTAGYQQPAQVIINNEQLRYDEHAARRPSPHHHRQIYYREDDYADVEVSRSRSRHRVRTPSPYYENEYELQARLRRLDELERRDEDARRKRRIEEELLLEAAKKEAEKAARKKEEDELKKKAIVEYNAKQAEEKLKKKKAEGEADKEYKERMWKTLHANGYTDHEIEDILRKGETKDQGHGHGHGQELVHMHGPEHGHGHGHHDDIVHVHGNEIQVVPLNRPTYIKVHKRHLDIETLEVYGLPWEWDVRDTDYIIIKQWVPEHDQDILFEHTRQRREKTQLMITSTELKKDHGKLLLVRKKEHVRKRSPMRH
ncbi:hypothetical protein MMC13_004563 [Lambiella insularis]|nr:hypothetical protein [Lambiella insularis]